MTAPPGATLRILTEIRDSDFPEDWYDYGSEAHFWIDWRFRAFRRLLADKGISTPRSWKGLDIGCGRGTVQRQMGKAFGWAVDGCDLNAGALRENHTAGAALMLYDIRECRREFAGVYDFIVLFDVIEHIAEPGAFLAAALFHLKPGGYVFVNVPALPSLFSRYDEVAGHHRRYDERLLASELGAAGLEIVESRYWGLSLVPLLWARKQVVARMVDDRAVLRVGFKTPSAAIATALKVMMHCELALLRRPPMGTSLLLAATKPIP